MGAEYYKYLHQCWLVLNLLVCFKKGASDAGAFLFHAFKNRPADGLWLFLLTIAAILLYAPFLSSPPFFDDENYFQRLGSSLKHDFQFAPRWLPYWSIDITGHFLGANITPLRITNLLLHLGTVIASFYLVRRLLSLVQPEQKAIQLAFAGALLFGLQPIAVFATGYMIQRTVLMATLFSLLMWLTFLRGSLTQRPGWLYASAAFFLLAAYSKEHAVTAVAICPVFLAWLWRSKNLTEDVLIKISRHHWMTFILYGLVAASVVASKMGYIAAPYEPSISYLLADLPFDASLAYPFSLLTQSGLFFKYLFLWVVPNTAWMSVDMREPIAVSFVSWPYIVAPLAFVAYIGIALRLLWQGGRIGLWGVALLIPALMFATELSTVRIQEPFVLYRSYLWLPVSYGLAVAGVFALLTPRLAMAMLVFMASALALFSANQLYTFTQPQFIWDQSAQLIEGRPNLLGIDRIYHNRGQAYYDLGMLNEAKLDYDKAIELAPMLPYSYNNRGALFLDMKRYQDALVDFNRAISISQSANPLMGRGLTYLALGQEGAAKQDFDAACKRGFKRACEILKEPGNLASGQE